MGWLIITFSWGIFRLIATIGMAKTVDLPTGMDNDMSNWSFGQVMSVVLLITPSITIIEYYDRGKAEVSCL